MKGFSLKRMMQFSKLQLNELFLNKTATEAIKLLSLRSFTITFICLFIKQQDGIKECISLIELLLILFSYYYSFLALYGNLMGNKDLLNKVSVPATITEKQISLYCSTIFIGTVIIMPCIIISNLMLQAAIPFVFGDEVNGSHIIFGGGGKSLTGNITAMIIVFHIIILTPVVLLYHQFKKSFFWIIFSAFIMSYGLAIVFMYGLNIPKDIIKFVLILFIIIWSILAVLITNKGLRKVELR